MEDALSAELLKKETVVKRVLEITAAQNEAIKGRDTERIISLDSEKQGLLAAMAEMDNSIKPFILKNKRYPASVQDTVKRINISLNNLIVIERENEKLLSAMELSASGRHIEAYKKAVK